MEDPSTDGLLDAGGAADGEGAGGGQGGEGIHRSDEGEAAPNLAPSTQRLPDPRRKFRTPQAIKISMQVDNSQLRPSEPQEFPPVENSHAYELSRMEAETESTASSPQPPLPRGRGYSSKPEMRFPNPAGVRIGASNRGILGNDENGPSRHTTSKVGGPPTADDWLEARKLISVFKLFYNVTVRFSGQLYVTSSAFFHDFLLMHNKIALLIQQKEQEAGLASMAENMKQKFDKYWDNHDGLNPLLFIAVALDPRYKVKYLDFCFSNIYGKEKAKSFTKKVEDGLTRLFEWYAESESTTSNTEAPRAPLVVDLEECADDPRRLWASNFKEHLQVIESKAANTELSRFLSELCEQDTNEFNILSWWRRQQNKYPTLSKVAKDVLAVPVSTVASESSFSTGGRVINPQRSSLSPKMVEALICAQSWLRTSPHKIDVRQRIADLHKYEELAQELGPLLECGET